MTSDGTNDVLDVLLKRIRDSSENNLLPAEITYLTSAFLSTRSDSTTVRPKAYLVLSAFCQGARASRKESDAATKIITKNFGQATLQYLGETDETSLLTGISFLTALFQVDSQAACSIFAEDGLVENLMDSVDLSPSDDLSQNLAHLLGQACGHKSCRAIMSPQIVRWLEFKSGQTRDPILRGAAAVALIKMSKGAVSDGPENGTPEIQMDRSDKLAAMMVDIVISEQTSSVVNAIEGLGYLSMEPTVKELLSKDKVFLKKLFALVPSQKLLSSTTANDPDPTLIYGVLVIVCNLVAYRPRLSEEQKQVENLKRITKTKTGKGLAAAPEAVSSLENDDHVKARIHSVLEVGVLSVFSAAISSTASLGVRVNVGKSLLSIVEERENRGQVLQAGGAKVLQIIIRKGLSTVGSTSNDKKFDSNALDLEPIQALAKLAITSSPVHVFGPNVGAMYDAIRPLSIMLQNPSSNLLQRFEAIMALTNLASYSADMASRIASAQGLLDKIELLLLEEHTLVRRASMELICNLIAGSDTTFERYGGGKSLNSTSKIHVLLALSDVDDLPTRLAASGALATLTSAPSVCHALIALQLERHRFLPIMTQLIDPSAAPAMEVHQDQPLETHPGLIHRGIVCIRNVFNDIGDDQTRETITKEAKESGLLEALVQLLKRDGVAKEILQQTAEALTLLVPVNRT